MKKITIKPTRRFVLNIALGLLLVANAAQAQAEKSDHEISLNATVVSDFRFRGLSQTRLKPAIQGALDYTHIPSGWYVGVWASNIKWTRDAGGGGHSEWDLVTGKRGKIHNLLHYDAGIVGYAYPGHALDPNPNTVEMFGELGFGPTYIKYSQALTNLSGFTDSRRSGYLDLGANLKFKDDITLHLHIGHQTVRNNPDFSYTDYKLGLTKEFGATSVGLALVRADTQAYLGQDTNLGQTGLVLTVSSSF